MGVDGIFDYPQTDAPNHAPHRRGRARDTWVFPALPRDLGISSAVGPTGNTEEIQDPVSSKEFANFVVVIRSTARPHMGAAADADMLQRGGATGPVHIESIIDQAVSFYLLGAFIALAVLL